MNVLVRAALVGAVAICVAAAPSTGNAASSPPQQTLTGTVRLIDHEGSRQQLVVGQKAYELALPGGQLLPSGMRISASGTRDRMTFTARRYDVAAGAEGIDTTGTQTVKVIRVQWDGNPADNTSVQDVQDAFTTLSTWTNKVSEGLLPSFAVSVDPTYETVAVPEDCGAGGAKDLWELAVVAAGIDPADWDHVIVYRPDNGDCSYAGVASIGYNYMVLNGTLSLGVVAHEMGHNLGLHHSHSLTCNDNTVTIGGSCTDFAEYGDPADTMGSGESAWYNASQRDLLGWLGAGVKTLSPCAGPVTLQPYESNAVSGNPVAVQVPTGTGSTYWLEYRKADVTEPDLTPLAQTGVLLHLVAPVADGPMLLDGTPDGTYDLADAPIASGSTVVTPEGPRIAVTATTSTSASLTLSTTLPSGVTSPTATAVGGDTRLTWGAPECTGSVSPGLTYDATSPGRSGTVSGLTATFAGAAALDRTYSVTATNSEGNAGAANLLPASAPRITGLSRSRYLATVFYGPSLSNGGTPLNGYYLDSTVDGDPWDYEENGTRGAGHFDVPFDGDKPLDISIRGFVTGSLTETPVTTLHIKAPITGTLTQQGINVGQSATMYVHGKPGSAVQVLAYSAPSSTYAVVRSGTLNGSGDASFSFAPRTNTHLFARTVTNGDSTPAVLSVRPAESLKGSASGRKGSFSGQIVPGHGGVKVRLFSVKSGRLTLVGTATTSSSGAWSLTHTFAGPGTVSFISQTVSDATSLAGQSNRISLTFH
jgi:hypothetical protein